MKSLSWLLASALAGGPGLAQTAPEDRALRPQQALATPISERRVALVIGNGAYRDAPLRNPVQDARAMAATLRDVGFDVDVVTDAGRKAMLDAVRIFGQKLTAGGVGLFYYAGHGMQVKGTNYLVPVGVEIASEEDVQSESLDANTVLARMDAAKNRVNLVILDACRNNPFARSFRSGSRGLVQMEAPSGTFIAFATAPGSTAADGEGQNGLYTQHLLQALREPGLSVEQVFKKVRVGVKLASRDQQVPWDSSSLTGEFSFVDATPGPPLAGVPLPPASAAPAAMPALPAAPPSRHQAVLDLIYPVAGKPDTREGVIRVQGLAESGDPWAHALLAMFYRTGWGMPMDPTLAYRHFQKAADLGEGAGFWGTGEALAGNLPVPGVARDYPKAYAAYLRAGELGDPRGLQRAAHLLRNGLGVEKNPARALSLERQAFELCGTLAATGDPIWAFVLGYYIEHGWGTPKDMDQALRWMRVAAERSLGGAQVRLSQVYWEGRDVPRDVAASLQWLQRAVDLGDPNAIYGLGAWTERGQGVPKDEARAVALYRQAALLNLPSAQAALSICLDAGRGVPKDPVQALLWLRKAAEGGHPKAQASLAAAYESGKYGLPKDPALAREWYGRAAAQGLAEAEAALKRLTPGNPAPF